jgi:prepilin-type N-terminal cleavage/methylation domain-containing protein/prepilin-type processing-associated H-X9-DG protein
MEGSRSSPGKKSLRPRCWSSAFTLVELLASLAVMAVLLAAVGYAVAGALSSARSAKCLSNMRQLGMAIHTYAGEHHGKLPRTRHSAAAQQAWIFQLRPYLDNVDAIRISPADPNGAERLRRNSTSYIVNDAVFDPKEDFFGNIEENSIAHLYRIQNPGRTILAFIISDNRGTGPSNDHTHVNRWTSFAGFLADVEADRHRVGPRSSQRNRGSAHYLYADGSVRSWKPEDLQPLLDSSRNIGLPGMAPGGV